MKMAMRAKPEEKGQSSELPASINEHDRNCKCVVCKNNNPFEITEDLRESFRDGKIAIFAGAGISTEGSNIVGYSFYDEMRSDLNGVDAAIEFPDLVSSFCNRPNGRLRFIEKITKRFANIRSTPDFYIKSTKFHSTLAPIKLLDTIVTTNWDDFFERECWATPFVFNEDTAFWSAADRKILKIHGTIENLGSLVASREDYEKCQERLSKDLIGSRLKIILSEKTVVFCGYSLKDFDFKEIMKFVQTEMNGFHRQPYIVTLDESDDAKSRYAEFGIIPIFTDASYFLEKMNQDLILNRCFAPVSMYDAAEELLFIVREEHDLLAKSISMFEYPQVIYSMFYQDGLIHCLQRVSLLRKSGEYSDLHLTQIKIMTYERMKKKALQLRRYDDAAYIEGYSNGLLYSVMYKDDPESYPPLYFMFKEFHAWNMADFEERLKDNNSIHTPSLNKAKKIVSHYKPEDNIIIDHACTLFGLHVT